MSASAVTVEELEIVVRAKIEEALKPLEKVMAKVREVMSSPEVSKAIQQTAQQVAAQTQRIAEVGAKCAPKIKQAFAGAQPELQRLTAELERVDQKMQEIANNKFAEMDHLKGLYAQMSGGNGMQEYNAEVGKQIDADPQMKALIKEGDALQAKIDAINAKLQQTKPVIQSVAQEVQRAGGIIAAIIEKMRNAFARAGPAIKKAVGHIKDYISRTRKAIKENTAFASGLSKIVSMFKLMLIRQAMRQVFKAINEGIQDMAKAIPSVNSAMSAMATGLLSIRNGLTAALYPAIQAIIPLVEWLGNAFISAGNAIAAFFARLSGASSFVKAKKAVTEYAGGVDKAANSAKKALAPFDELNTLQEQSGGSGSGGASPSDMFEEVAVDSSKFSWVDDIRKAFEEGDFYKIGEIVGGKINEALAKIDWVSIQTWAATTATNLAMLLNGAVAGIDWVLVGSTVGNGINTALIFAYTWLTGFNWLQWGQAVATGLNSMISTVNWVLLGATFAAWVMSIFDTAYGIVTTFEWAKFGIAIGTAINSFFVNINWATVGQTISTGIIGALSTISTAIAEVDWVKIGEDVKTFLVNIDWMGIINATFNAIGSALGGIYDFLSALLGEPVAAILIGIATALGLVAAAIGAVNTIMTIYKAYTVISAAVTALFGVSLSSLLIPIALVAAAIAAVIAIVVLLVKHWDEVKETAARVWQGIVDVWSVVAGWFNDNIVTPVFEFFAGFWANMLLGFQTLWDDIALIWSIVADWFNNTIVKPIANFFGGLWKGIKTGASTLADFMRDKVIDPIVTLFKGMYDSVVGIVEGMINGFIGVINGFIRGINRVIEIINEIPGVGLPSLNTMPTVSIPRFAQGAVLTKPTVGLMAEYSGAATNPEYVLPEKKLTGVLAETLASFILPLLNITEEQTARIEAAIREQDFDVQLDGESVVRRLRPHQARENMRVGSVAFLR